MSLNKIGIIGGGQLGMMLCEEAKLLGAKTIVLDPSKDAPAFKIADEHICATFDDFDALEDLCKRADVITYEFENVRSDFLIKLEDKYNIKQGFKPLFDGQDRIREKTNANNHGLKTARFFDVTTKDDALNAIKELGYPCLYKTRTLGYDGHGQVLLKSDEDIKILDPFFGGLGGSLPSFTLRLGLSLFKYFSLRALTFSACSVDKAYFFTISSRLRPYPP